MKIWTAVVLSGYTGEYYGTSLAETEPELIKKVRENYDPEGDYNPEENNETFNWDGFSDFYQLDIRVDEHEL